MGGLFGFYASCLPGEYSTYAKIFPLSSNEARSSSSAIDALRSQFGIQGGGSGGDAFDLNELIKSKTFGNEVMASRPENKKYSKFYDWVIESNNKHIPFFYDEIVKSSDEEKNIITASSIIRSKTEITKNESGYTTFLVKSYDKELAREIIETTLGVLSDYYIDFVTEKPSKDLQVITKMRDSLNASLNAVTKAIAGYEDKNAFAVKSYVGLPRIKLEREKQEITALYSSTVQALQNARFKVLYESPIFQVLDWPGEPYGYTKTGWKKFAIVGFLLSFFLLNLWFCRKVFFNIIIEELKKA